MRKLFFTFAAAVAALFLAAGCASTHSTITEYDAGSKGARAYLAAAEEFLQRQG